MSELDNNYKDEILKAAKLISKDGEVKIIKRLLGGMSNYTYVVIIDGAKYVIRIPGQYGELFVNRKEEKYNLEQVAKIGLVKESLYFNVDTGVKITPYIEGESLNNINVDEEVLRKIANTLKTLHTSNIKAFRDYDYIGRINEYERHVKHYDVRYIKLKGALLNLIGRLNKLPRVFSHGDCQRSNFILGEDKKLYLVDYEYSGNASIYFDLGVFGYLNFPNAVKLAELYFERRLTLNDLVLLHIVNLQQYVQWYTVARIKEEKGLSSKLGVDFAKIAERYLEEGANHLKEIEKLLRYN